MPDVAAVYTTLAVYAADLPLMALVSLSLGARPLVPAPGWRLLHLCAFLLPAAAALSALQSPTPLVPLGVALHLALLSLAWRAAVRLRVAPRWLAIGLVAAAVPESLLAIGQSRAQAGLLPPGWFPWLPPADPEAAGAPVILDGGQRLLRAFGTLSHPNVLGGYLALTLVLLPSLVYRQPFHRVATASGAAAPRLASGRRALAAVAALLLVAGLFVTYSRAAWAAVLVGAATWCLLARQRWVRFLPVAAGALALGLVLMAPNAVRGRLLPTPENTLELRSAYERLWLIDLSRQLLARHPLWGTGIGNTSAAAQQELQPLSPPDRVHLVPLLVVVETGLPGAAALVLGAGGLILHLRHLSPPERRPRLAALVALTTLAVADHYLWSLPAGRTLAWAVLTWATLPPPAEGGTLPPAPSSARGV